MSPSRLDHPLKMTVYVITLNEESNLARCLRSVKGLAEELIVVDSGSSDRTVEIAKEMGARVIHQPYLGGIEQRQFAHEQAQGEWVLSLDADEWLEPRLCQEITQRLDQSRLEIEGFLMNRRSFYLGREIRHSGWSPEWKLRLARKAVSSWDGYDPHPHLKVNGKTQRLQGLLYHDPCKDIRTHVRKLDTYTTVLTHQNPSRLRYLFGIFIEPGLVFLQKYFIQRGILDGIRGFAISVMTAFYFFLRYLKAWEAANETSLGEPDQPSDPTGRNLHAGSAPGRHHSVSKSR